MSLYVKATNSTTAATAGDGRWHAVRSVAAPSGYFVVSGSWVYDTPSSLTQVSVLEDAHRSFNGGTENLPTEYEVSVSADASGILYVYVVCRELP